MSDEQQAPTPPAFDPDKPHHAMPKIRGTIAGSPVGVQTPNGQQSMLALGDRSQVVDRPVVTSPLAQFMLPHMNGERGPAQIAEAAREQATKANLPEAAVQHLTEENVRLLIAQLDGAGLLHGPTFDAILEAMHAEYDKTDYLPPASTANLADALVIQEFGAETTDEQKAEHGPGRLRDSIDRWMDEALKKADDPSFDALPKAVFAPHTDYFRGWHNYGAVYGRMRVVDRPDRVIVLGTNNFGFGTGVVGCDKSFRTPLGDVARDGAFADLLDRHLGEENAALLYGHRFDHEREPSVELQLPWIQRIFGGTDGAECPPVFAALVHDPARNNGESYDGKGLSLFPFVDAMKAAIAEAPGRTLVVCSANLSHIGPAFGDRIALSGDTDDAKQNRQKVFDHDKEMLQLIGEGKAEELVASIAWQQNPTRWNSTGPIVAAMKVVDAGSVRLLNYAAAADNQGQALISSFAGVVD